jgi:hypothetical protein
LRSIVHAMNGPVKSNVVHEMCIHGRCIRAPSHRNVVLLKYSRRRLTLSREMVPEREAFRRAGPRFRSYDPTSFLLNLYFCVKNQP